MKPAPAGGSLHQWLAWLELLDPDRITPGLERVVAVGRRLGVLQPAGCVISIAGTNGKGSSATLLEQTLLHAGHRVAVYSSPHLLAYNERLRLNGHDVDSRILCEAFEHVASAQGDTPLSYFEFGTLAVLWIISSRDIDVSILEVGLGGRLDAVNAVDADCALITSIGLDHQDWLGSDREAIGREKAGIMRQDRPLICNDTQPPGCIAALANTQGARLLQYAQDYKIEVRNSGWSWSGLGEGFDNLPEPGIPGAIYRHNAAGVLAVLMAMRSRLPWREEDFAAALRGWAVPGRAQRLEFEGRSLWLDVAHNREAARALAEILAQHSPAGRTLAVFAVLKDKPVGTMMQELAGVVDEWHLAGLPDVPRGQPVGALVESARQAGLQWYSHERPPRAWSAALKASRPQDRLVVLGSFHTVQAVLETIHSKETQNG